MRSTAIHRRLPARPKGRGTGSPGPWSQGLRLMWVLLVLAVLELGIWAHPVRANGVPVEVYLDFVPMKANWTPAQHGQGVAVLSANDEEVQVRAQDLPAPPVGMVYYAWLEKVDGSFLPVGPLAYAEDGTATITQPMPNLPYSENFAWVLVALEFPDRVGTAPSDQIALAGRLPNPVALPVEGNQAPELLPVTGRAAAATRGLWPPTGWAVAVLVIAGVIAWQWLRRQRTAPSGAQATAHGQDKERTP